MNIKTFRRPARAEGAGLDAVEQALNDIAPLTLPVPVDLDEARERELGMRPIAETSYVPTPLPQLPAYVEHSPEATPTGIACGEAIVIEYEKAAKEIEALGVELKARIEVDNQAKARLAEAFTQLTETAKAYRDEAKRVFEQVEATTAKANQVSELCRELQGKLKPGE